MELKRLQRYAGGLIIPIVHISSVLDAAVMERPKKQNHGGILQNPLLIASFGPVLQWHYKSKSIHTISIKFCNIARPQSPLFSG